MNAWRYWQFQNTRGESPAVSFIVLFETRSTKCFVLIVFLVAW